MAARLLLQRQRRCAGGRAAPHVHDLRSRVEPRLGTESRGAVEQVDLLGVEEERLVEASQPLVQLPPHEHAGARQPVHPPCRVVREVAAVEAVEGAGARRELAQVEVLRGQAEDGREAPAGALQAPVGPEQPRPDRAGGRARLGEAHELVDRPGPHERVAVQQQQPAPRGDRRTAVVAGAEADVPAQRHEADVRVLGREPGGGAVPGGLVDDDRLDRRDPPRVGRQGREAARQELAALVAHDHDRDVGHARRRFAGAARARRPAPRPPSTIRTTP